MDIADVLTEGGVALRGGASSKRQALHLVSELAAPLVGIDEGRLVAGLLEREALGSTGLGGGVAVPHARILGLKGVTGVFLRLDQPVAFSAVDDRPVDLLFAIFASPTAGTEHLRALAAVSRALRSPIRREQLRQAKSIDAVRALFVRDEASATAA